MRTLVLCDDTYHPAPLTRDGLLGLGDCGHDFEWQEDGREWSAEQMDTYEMVVFSKANNTSLTVPEPWANEETGQAFVNFVEAGKSILFLHSGTALYNDSPSLCHLMGGIFTGHPKPCPVTVEPLAGHLLTAGSEAFTLTDEHYQMEMNDPNVDQFLQSVSEHNTQPAGWTRTQGNGRVCVLTPGHFPNVWAYPSYQAILQNSLAWCRNS